MLTARRYLANARATLKDPPYVLWLFVMITVHLGTLTPIVHLVARGIDIGKLKNADNLYAINNHFAPLLGLCIAQVA